MTKKRREQLPGPGDSRWAPLDDLHAPLIPRTGNRDLAAHDLTKLLATPPPYGVRSMRRYFGRYRDLSRPELEWELLEFSFWEEHALSSWSDGLCIVRPKQGVSQAVQAVGLYGWKPDFDKAVPGLAPASDSPTDAMQPPLQRRGPVLTHDWFSICGEIARRCIDPKTGHVQVPKKGSSFVADMRNWCVAQGWAAPARSEMSEAVRRICAAMMRAEK